MDLKQLQSLGAFVPETLVTRTITFRHYPQTEPETWADPAVPEYAAERVESSAEVLIRKRNSADYIQIVQAQAHDQPFLSVLLCVRNADGTPLFPDLATVKQLAEWMLVPLITAVNEVNSYLPGKSTPRTSSGAKSRSPSAGGRSRNGSSRSAKRSGRSG